MFLKVLKVSFRALTFTPVRKTIGVIDQYSTIDN